LKTLTGASLREAELCGDSGAMKRRSNPEFDVYFIVTGLPRRILPFILAMTFSMRTFAE
jgi:hypothetical protein